MKQKERGLRLLAPLFGMICVILSGLLLAYIPYVRAEKQVQEVFLQERLNMEIDELFRPSRQKRCRSGSSIPPTMRKCATPLLKRARKYQELLTSENKFILYRPTSQYDSHYYGNVNVASYVSQGGHFRLYYTDDNSNGDAVKDINYVYQFANYFEQAWEFIIDTLGYRSPIGEDEKIEVFILDISYYGMTAADNEGLYIIVDNEYGWARENLDNEGKEAGAMKVTAVHELFHVVQGEYDHWPVSNDENMWWEENTAVWIEDELYDNVDDYLGYLGWPYIDNKGDNGQWDEGEVYFDIFGGSNYWGRQKKWFDYPHLSLDSVGSNSDYYGFEYGGVVWAKFLSENFGRAMIRTIFEQFPPSEQFPPRHYSYLALEAIEGAIEEVGQSPIIFSEAFIQFKLANLLRQTYEEGNKYPIPFHEGSILDYPNTISDNLSYLSAKYFAFHKPSSGGQTIRISFEGGNSAMALLAVPAASYNPDNVTPGFPLFGTTQRIPLDNDQNGEYYFSFSENLSYSKLIIIPINLGWTWSALYSLQAEQLEESLLPPVPQAIQYSSCILDGHPLIRLGWQPVQDVDQFQIWRGLKGNYQSLIFQSAYGDANFYEDSDPDFLYPGKTYLYQIKFINAAGSSSSEIIELVVLPNNPPLFNQIGDKKVKEKKLLQFIITATDLDGDALTYSTGDLPAGADFDPTTQEFRWTPNINQSGNYTITFTVSDNGEPPLSDSEFICITVADVKTQQRYGGYIPEQYGYLYQQQHPYYLDFTGYQRQQPFSFQGVWEQPMSQLGQSWSALSKPRLQPQQQIWVQPFAQQSYSLPVLPMQSLYEPQHRYLDFTGYQQQQPLNFQDVWGQPIYQTEGFWPALSWNWYK